MARTRSSSAALLTLATLAYVTNQQPTEAAATDCALYDTPAAAQATSQCASGIWTQLNSVAVGNTSCSISPYDASKGALKPGVQRTQCVENASVADLLTDLLKRVKNPAVNQRLGCDAAAQPYPAMTSALRASTCVLVQWEGAVEVGRQRQMLGSLPPGDALLFAPQRNSSAGWGDAELSPCREYTRGTGSNGTCCIDQYDQSAAMKKRFLAIERQFGQCSSCVDNLKQFYCFTRCHKRNVEYFDFKRLRPQICNRYAMYLYASCKEVTWIDPKGKTLRIQDLDKYSKAERPHVVFANSELLASVDGDGARGRGQGSDKMSAFFSEKMRRTGADRCTSEAGLPCTRSFLEKNAGCQAGSKHHAVAVVALMVCSLFVIGLVAGDFVSEWKEKYDMPWLALLPSNSLLIIVGLVIGLLCQSRFLQHDDEDFASMVEFDAYIFAFVLLPVIIFGSAFTIDTVNLEALYVQKNTVLVFAIAGTMACSFATGVMFFAMTSCSWNPSDESTDNHCWDITLEEGFMFGALISAVDPVATLGAFASLGVDPKLNSLVYGESIVNDAVAIVMYYGWKESKTLEVAQGGSAFIVSVLGSTTWILVGSILTGLLTGMLAAILFQYIATSLPKIEHLHNAESSDSAAKTAREDAFAGLARQMNEPKVQAAKLQKNSLKTASVRHFALHKFHNAAENVVAEAHDKHDHNAEEQGMNETVIFFFCALTSFYLAEMFHLSGIISALVAGIWCNIYTADNLTHEGSHISHLYFHMQMHTMERLTSVWVGISCVLFAPHMWQHIWWCSFSLMTVVITRAVSVYFLSFVVNKFEHTSVPLKYQHMMVGAGLRGAVALVLVVDFPSSYRSQFIGITLFIVFMTNIVLGGLTAPLVRYLEIDNVQMGTLELQPKIEGIRGAKFVEESEANEEDQKEEEEKFLERTCLDEREQQVVANLIDSGVTGWVQSQLESIFTIKHDSTKAKHKSPIQRIIETKKKIEIELEQRQSAMPALPGDDRMQRSTTAPPNLRANELATNDE